MKKKKIILTSVATLMAIGTIFPFGLQAHTVQATDGSVRKTVMHNSIAYDKDGNKTGQKYYTYGSISVEPTPVTINGNQYYKISGKDQYVRVTNIDGVKRKVTHNAYIYRTSTQRTPYGMTASSKKWKLYKGETVTTYGGYYTFKNGKHYFKVGGPRKQYVRTYNLGPVIRTNTPTSSNTSSTPTTRTPNTTTNNTNAEEATVTVKDIYGVNIYNNQGRAIKKNLKAGTKFVVDRLEVTPFADQFPPTAADAGQYRIKGTDTWLLAIDVTANKKLVKHDYNNEHYGYIKFINDTDVYNADGTMQNHNGTKIVKQGGHIKVDKLVYIWVPSENKAELFYHLVGTKFYATGNVDQIEVGNNAYVKASDVEFINQGLTLTPSNTPEEAQAAAKK
ncbi:SLAP domain-containing protein [Lactobacillus helveticus]|uniref:S-layer protein n=1 Tax=Lactobacillus helveticus TaxID=1587 RepID=A0AAC9EZ67_LACHE|nr:SLAP domain-containing protein [Lactobacillus helveticus]ALI52275.1 s-layer protein [Lactobacillus helveticus]NRO03046.1 S-layer protein [Lactobacillus helveticus]NRO79245.1 S-layer protein [Lactobacillus helveticus]NRO89871.1 S-layer protein [Lactobacillus helveticus]NRO94218.1 S-layer protein [Lactobacillus helveticus]